MEKYTLYAYIPDRREWLGMVCQGGQILTIGAEQTEAEIKDWCQRALAGDESDMYDRRGRAH